MKKYDELRKICERNSRISERVVDDFLINYAAGHKGLEKKMDQHFKHFAHVTKKLGKANVNMLKSQYLAHRVFRENGLLGKFMKHPALDRFQGEERDFLAQALKLHWRFCFFVIMDIPSEDFYTIEDVLTGKRHLLYSQAVSDILDSDNPVLWFNLIGFNGYCWQSYGPVVYYMGFGAGDIWFFATEMDPSLEDGSEVAAHVEQDPLPYMMLITGATYPLTFHKEDRLYFQLAEHEMDTLDTAALKKGFRTEYDSGVYRISHKKLGGHPHFAQAFFDEEEQLLLFSAMTRRSFVALVEGFNAFGYDFPVESYLQVNWSMVSTTSEVLNKKVVVNEYLNLFELDTEPRKEKVLKDVNAFIALVLPDINAGIEPDIEAAARETGVDIETARSVVKSAMDSLDRLPDLAAPGKKGSSGTAGSSGTKGSSGTAGSSEKKASSGKKKSAKKPAPTITKLPVQPTEGIRLLTSDDKLLFDLYLYLRAGDIRSEAPWEYLFEDEIFGVQIPGTDRVWFVSVMGSEGEFPSVAFYRGFGGLEGFRDFRYQAARIEGMGSSPETMFRISTMPGGMMCIPHILLSFVDREDLSSKEQTVIRKSGARFRGKGHWPQIEEIVPGYLPEYPDRESLQDLYLVMKQVLVVLDKVAEDEFYLVREDDPKDTFLVRVPSGKGPEFRWKDQYLELNPEQTFVRYAVLAGEDEIKALSRLPEASQEIQIDLAMLPMPVGKKGQKAYFPFALLIIDKNSEMVLSSTVLSPEPDLHSMYESIPPLVVDELLKLGHRSGDIEIRSDLLVSLLDETLEGAGCRVDWVEEMPEMDEAIRSLISHLGANGS